MYQAIQADPMGFMQLILGANAGGPAAAGGQPRAGAPQGGMPGGPGRGNAIRVTEP